MSTPLLLKKSASYVLAALRRHWALTGSRPFTDLTCIILHVVNLIILRVANLAAAAPAEQGVLARRGWAGENDVHFEHPVGFPIVIPHNRAIAFRGFPNRFSTAC